MSTAGETNVSYKAHLAGTVVNCDEVGHCWHQGTAVRSLWCCRCGAFQYDKVTFTEIQNSR